MVEEVVAKVLRRAVSDEQVIVFYLFVCFCGREEEEEEDLQAEVDNTESRKSMGFFSPYFIHVCLNAALNSGKASKKS